MKKKIAALLVFTSLFFYVPKRIIYADPKPWQVETNGWLSFPHYMQDGAYRFMFSPDLMPDKVLRFAKIGIEYALDNGAAKKIDRFDLYHAHFLSLPDRQDSEMTPGSLDALLFHSQEWTEEDVESFLKRNIFVDPDGCPSILPCDASKRTSNGKYYGCTYYTAPGFKLSDSPGIYFVVVDQVPNSLLKPYRHNIIRVNGHKVLIGIPVWV